MQLCNNPDVAIRVIADSPAPPVPGTGPVLLFLRLVMDNKNNRISVSLAVGPVSTHTATSYSALLAGA